MAYCFICANDGPCRHERQTEGIQDPITYRREDRQVEMEDPSGPVQAATEESRQLA
jgi:hypothetical protein